MSLRIRLVVLFLVAAFVPFGAFGLMVRTRLIHSLEEEHARRLREEADGARRAIAEQREADRRAADALCEDALVVESTLLQLATERFGPAAERTLVRLLPPLMRGRGFDALFLLDAGGRRGRVLGAAHYTAEAGADAAFLLDALGRAGDAPFVAEIRVRGEDGPENAQAILQGCTVARDGAAVGLVAGRLLEDFEDRFTSSTVGFQLTDQAPDLPGSLAPLEVHRFAVEGGEPLVLYANIDDAPLRAEIRSLKSTSVYVAVAAVVLALLMALILTFTVVGPIRSLERAAQRVAQGDLDSRVTITRSDEVGSAMSAFNEMTRELAATREKLLRAERIAAWREVARRIAHEIKNPLQPIQMEIETMRKLHARGHASFDDDFESSTQLILDEVKRLNTMVTEFSRFARLPRPRPEAQDLAEVVEHVGGLHAGFALDVHAESVVVRFDREQLTQVLVNLVQNALDAASARHGEGARVELELEPAEGGARVEVRDNGPGISPEDRLRIFEPYFTTKSTGTGLGLAIVHRIVGDHNGTIDVQDGIDGGASFVIFLPSAGPTEAIAASLSDRSLPLGRTVD